MIELAIAAALGALPLLVGLYLVDRKRRQAWVRIASDEMGYVADAELVGTNHEAALREQERSHAETMAGLTDERSAERQAAAQTLRETLERTEAAHNEAEAHLALVHREASETAGRGAEALQATVSELRAEIEGLMQLHGATEGLRQVIDQHHAAIEGLNETKAVADRVVSDHDWHIAGKGEPHGKGVLIRWECDCGTVTYAPEGTF